MVEVDGLIAGLALCAQWSNWGCFDARAALKVSVQLNDCFAREFDLLRR
jgi:hypothetical protein